MLRVSLAKSAVKASPVELESTRAETNELQVHLLNHGGKATALSSEYIKFKIKFNKKWNKSI
jgi:hypothetical protein|tara:strand:- start:154 stop:339 length:186 start_codon:yes stop_codon:yes gene_type:complete